jgi:hypothetical protein
LSKELSEAVILGLAQAALVALAPTQGKEHWEEMDHFFKNQIKTQTHLFTGGKPTTEESHHSALSVL